MDKRRTKKSGSKTCSKVKSHTRNGKSIKSYARKKK